MRTLSPLARQALAHFPARQDKLQALKHGKSVELLQTWVAGLFNTFGPLTPSSLEKLALLAHHPFAPASVRAKTPLPRHALRNEAALRAAVAAGFSPANLVDVPPENVRLEALYCDAPPGVHALLDSAGVPPVSLLQANKALPESLHALAVHSLRHLMANPEVAFWVRQELGHGPRSPLSIAIAKLWSAHVNPSDHDAKPKRWRPCLEIFARAGCDLRPAYSLAIEKWTDRARFMDPVLRDQEKALWKEEIRFVLGFRVEQLEASLPAAPAAAPRPSSRF